MPRSQSHRRVVATGAGVVSAAGQSVAELWSALRDGVCAIKPIETFYQNHPSVLPRSAIKHFDLAAALGAQVAAFDQRTRLRHIKRDKLVHLSDRTSLFAAAAADEAMSQAGLAHPLADPRRAACIIGSAEGGVTNIEVAYRNIFELRNPASHPMTVLRTIGSSPAAHIGIEYGIKGPVFGTCGGGGSAAQAIGICYDYIRHGSIDVALAGGCEAPHTFGTMRLWEAAGLLSDSGLAPFAAARSGTVLGEGAGMLVIEALDHARDRGAAVRAELCGIGLTADATDMVVPDRDGAVAAMRMAMADAGLGIADIDCICANGDGSRLGDAAEAEALREVFGLRLADIPVTATKATHGNSLGASAGIEAAICLEIIAKNWIPPTVGGGEIDRSLGLDVVAGRGRMQACRYVMANAFGLGGLNASMIFGPAPD